jgi:hypothetical protein
VSAQAKPISEVVKDFEQSLENLRPCEVVRDGVRALLERDAAVERWLREEVVPGHQEYLRDPSKIHETDLRGGRQNGYQIRSLGTLAVPFDWRTIGLARRIPHRKEGTNLSFLKFFRRRRAQRIGVR